MITCQVCGDEIQVPVGVPVIVRFALGYRKANGGRVQMAESGNMLHACGCYAPTAGWTVKNMSN